MVEKKLNITASIEARDVALIVQIASKFSSNIKIQLENKTINAKSIMGLIALGDLQEKDITIIAEGADEEDASKTLARFLAR